MKIAIITGGETGERDVSIRSAKNISDLIDFAEKETFIFPEEKEKFMSIANTFSIAIPVIHGAGGEDGTLQTLLKSINLPFIFSDINTHEVAIDKKHTKEIVKSLGITSPKEIESFPVFVKPIRGGSSIASKLCNSQKEFDTLLKNNPDIKFIKEEPVKGREFTVGIVEHNREIFALPVVEIISKEKFFDFDSKYNPDKLASEICPAEISEELSKELQKQALEIHKYLKARHLSRSDFIVTNDNAIYFLEINTIPGMTNTSLIPKMLGKSGLSLKELIIEWCQNN